jgi:PAS domain S-box-containing protein/putative nucleotidyltransferase with HDIG domain
VIDANLRFTYVSPSVTSLLGYDAEEFTGRSFDELLTPDSLALMTQVYTDDMAREASTLGSLKERSVEMEAIRKDGSTVWLEAAITPVRDKQGRFTRFQGACRDITERRRAQGVLRESEERFRTLIEKSTDAVAILDANGKLVYESPSMERITGYKLEDWLGKPVEDWLLHPDDMAKMASLLEQLTSHPKVESQDICVRFKHKDGSWHFLEGTARNLLGDPKVKGLVINYRDVTERRQAEELLRNSEERFRGLVETTSDWVWEIDRDFRYTYVSPKVRDILGYEPHELLGHSPLDFMHQTEGRRVAKIVRRFADAHLPFSLLENTCTHKDGRPVVLEASAVPILDSEGGFLGYRGINRDISERKKVEQELKHSLKRLGKTMESIIEAITTTIETRDPYTSGHQMRVTNLACAIARVMELPPAQIEGIRVAGLLHDIGKIAVPTEILTRPGNLNKVEYEMIKTHVQVGYNILKNIEFPSPVARVVLQHHERWNGTGYPNGIRGGDILLEARILAVADVMEAMASDRPYRPSPGLDKALDEITKNSAILYDPAVVNACLAVFSRGGFKFTSSILDVVRESGGMSPDRPVRPLEDR